MPTFSVVIPTRDRPQHLKEAIASVLAQTVQDFEIIVVDDGGSIPAQVPDDARVRVMRREQPIGPAGARNIGLLASHGIYLTLLDDDDLFTPNRLALGLQAMAHQPISVCAEAILDQRSNSPAARTLRRWKRRPWFAGLPIVDGIQDTDGLDGGELVHTDDTRGFPQVGRVTIQREVAPLFNERLIVEEDVDWWIRVLDIAKPTQVPWVGWIRRIHSPPRVRSQTDLEDALQSTLYVLHGHAEYFGAHPGAGAFRWRRVGFLLERLGRRSEARDAFRHAASIMHRRPSRWDMTRSLLPVPAGMRSRL